MQVTVTHDVTLERISDMLCSALEGGSNYWYTIKEFVKPPKLEFRSSAEHIHRHLDYPLNVGGALIITTLEQDEFTVDGRPYKDFRLDLNTIQIGLNIMSAKYQRHWGDFVHENDDATTGDVFLQCCLFREIVYG